MEFLYYYAATIILCNIIIYYIALYKLQRNEPIAVDAFFEFEEEWAADENEPLFEYGIGFFHFVNDHEMHELIDEEYYVTYINNQLTVVYRPRRSCRPRG